jgi:hypothetical protein
VVAAAVKEEAERLANYRALFRPEPHAEAISDIRRALDQGQPLGDARFIDSIERATGQRREVRPRGRPQCFKKCGRKTMCRSKYEPGFFSFFFSFFLFYVSPTSSLAMRNRKPLSSTVLLFALAGCATPQPQPGLPSWDYERDELKIQNQATVIGGGFGVLGGIFGGVAGAVVGGLQEGIELTPPELSSVILRTLTPRTNETPQGAISLASNSPDDAKNSWTVSDSNEGQITTDWKRIPGRKAGILWWQKEYESQVRHTITIKQSFRTPRQTNYSILTEVRERPNENYDWVNADPELGRQSFEDIKGVLLTSVRAELAKRRPRK